MKNAQNKPFVAPLASTLRQGQLLLLVVTVHGEQKNPGEKNGISGKAVKEDSGSAGGVKGVNWRERQRQRRSWRCGCW